MWKKRKEPPKDWNKPLPEWLNEQYENSYLAYKSAHINADKDDPLAKAILCTIM